MAFNAAVCLIRRGDNHDMDIIRVGMRADEGRNFHDYLITVNIRDSFCNNHFVVYRLCCVAAIMIGDPISEYTILSS